MREMRNPFRIWSGNQGKKLLVKPKLRWKDNISLNEKWGVRLWAGFIWRDRVQLGAFVNSIYGVHNREYLS
jgi:hypothetical protein